tara:strand:- start:171 stop:305 length:135 start_codon:yes stop_codon:yes gene_type:complete
MLNEIYNYQFNTNLILRKKPSIPLASKAAKNKAPDGAWTPNWFG